MHLQPLLKLTIGLCILSVVLVACDSGDPTPEPEPTVDAEAQTQPTEQPIIDSFTVSDTPDMRPTATQTPPPPPPTEVPLDVQFADLPAGDYSLSMVGALNSDIGFTPFDPGLSGTSYRVTTTGTNRGGPYEFSLWTDILTDGTTDDTTARIRFVLPATAEAGTYEVVGLDAMTNPTDIGVEIVTAFESQRFGSTASGTMNIVNNGGVGGVFTGEFEVTVGDDEGNTILATGRASAIPFTAEESAELTITGAIEANPTLNELIYSLGRGSITAGNNDWVLDITTTPTENNPYIIQHRFFMRPEISVGTFDVAPRVSELDLRPENMDVTAYVEMYNPNDGTQLIPTNVSGTLEVLPGRDSFSATFTLTYTVGEGDAAETATATGGAYYLFKPAS